jgi:uncharacterized circularly permuted ATP-grasp superfamily protein
MLQENPYFSRSRSSSQLTDSVRFDGNNSRAMPLNDAVSALNAGSTLQATAITPVRTSSISNPEPMNTGFVPKISALPSGTQECSLGDDRLKDLSRGIQQRLEAVDAFLTDVTTHRNIPGFLRHHPLALKIAESIPRSLSGLTPGIGRWSWLVSTDLYISGCGEAVIVDHNFSCPTGFERLAGLMAHSGMHSLMERWLIARTQFGWCGFEQHAERLRVAVLSTGAFNPEQSEHEFLASQLGAVVLRNRDIVVRPDGLYQTLKGSLDRIDLLVRRIDDELLDPNCFRPDSLIGIPGLVRSCREGRVCVLNSPGTGIINHRAIGALIPEMIRWYLREVPVLDSANTLVCSVDSDRDLVLSNLGDYCIRTVDPQHPTRPFFGSSATNAEKAELTARLLRNPQHYIARPLLENWRTSIDGCRPGYNLRVFAGTSECFEMLPVGIGRSCQPDGGATLAVSSDPTAFCVNLNSV